MTNRFKISVMEALVLLMGVLEASKHPKIGHADPYISLEDFISRLSNGGPVFISKDDLESALWSLNMLNEENSTIWHPSGKGFNKFLEEMITLPYKFDIGTNRIIETKEKRKDLRRGTFGW